MPPFGIADIKSKKTRGEKITMLTAYDYPTAKIIDGAGIDIILVGDSLGMVVLGFDNTLSVTMDDMIRHASAVRRAVARAHVVGDMPYMSYSTEKDAAKNAERFTEAGCDSVKLEGGRASVPASKAILKRGIPVMGHIGLTPQSADKLGGYKVQGKTAEAAQSLIDDARALEDAGCYSIVLECIPAAVSALITKKVSIPTIGIGAGPDCDGQVIVFHDLVGLFDRFLPKFVKRYAQVSDVIKDAVTRYKQDVIEGRFPTEEHSYSIKKEELERLL